MWISILNYNSGQIEVADITDFDADIDKDSNIYILIKLLKCGYVLTDIILMKLIIC